MITQLHKDESSTLAFEVTGKVSIEEERRWTREIEGVIEVHGVISVMVILGEQASWGVKAGLEDLKWILTHLNKVHKIAIVADSSVWKWLVTMDIPFAKMVGIGERHFELSEENKAWFWVCED